VIPAVPLLAGLILFIVIIGFLAWLNFVPNKMPLNTFNVAVAEFGQVDSTGRVSSSVDGRNLSEWMFGELQTEYKNWPTSQPVVWHDSMGLTQKRVQLGLISGQTQDQRNEAAKLLADKIGANMVIYGNIDMSEQPVHFTPQFYIAEVRNEADEIVGRHQLGAPIEVRLPINLYDERTSAFFEGKLGTRVDALVWFTRGLALDLSGRQQEALATFKEAEGQLSGWADDQGKEILYYFLGREALYLGRFDPTANNKAEALQYLDEAKVAFNQALTINPGYFRAHIGLGGVYLQLGQHLTPTERLKTDDLALAIKQYQLAIEMSKDAAEVQVEFKGHQGLGSTYRLLGEAYLFDNNFAQADPNLDQAITEIKQAVALITEEQHRLLAQAYLELGSAYYQKAHIRLAVGEKTESKPLFEQARASYDQCARQADLEFYDSLLQEIKTKYCDKNRQEVQKALDNL
jgi:tetratricopeptide (TPR) repeat protein